MRWNTSDMEKYESSKEYIDTALIPIFKMDPDGLGVGNVNEQKWLEEICIYAERQLTGRMMLFPTMYTFMEILNLSNFAPKSFRHNLFITTNDDLFQKLCIQSVQAYLLERKENEEDLTEMVRQGKKLTKVIMEQWA